MSSKMSARPQSSSEKVGTSFAKLPTWDIDASVLPSCSGLPQSVAFTSPRPNNVQCPTYAIACTPTHLQRMHGPSYCVCCDGTQPAPRPMPTRDAGQARVRPALHGCNEGIHYGDPPELLQQRHCRPISLTSRAATTFPNFGN